jgi:hypothetical protein
MKKITNLRTLGIGVLFIGASLSLNAQQGRGQGMRGQATDEEGLNRHVEQLATDLQLNDKQKARVLELERDHLQTMEKERAKRGADRDAHYQAMEKLRTDHEAKMKQVLTEDQFNRWKETRQKQVRERKHDGKGKGKGFRSNGRGGSGRP